MQGAPEELEDRALVATAAGDGSVAVWDCRSGGQLRLLSGHTGEVASLEASGRGRFLLSASADGTARLWDLHSPVVEPAVPHLGGVAVRACLTVLYTSAAGVDFAPFLRNSLRGSGVRQR
jgi:WD40 repeat protein